jgi:geranylgeranyl pyrophosphate synthase
MGRGEELDTQDKLGEMRREIDAELGRVLAADGSRLFEAMRYAVLDGGKRFRPLLLLAAGEAFGAPRDSLLPYACAVELIHSYSLVHDDLPAMDNDDFRRGKPSCHKAFGEGLALLAGDGLLSLAFEVLTVAPHPQGHAERKEAALREIVAAAGVRGMIKGQWLDISLARKELDGSAFLGMIGKKTGTLIRASVKSGAILAGAPETGLEAVEEYGTALGLAFQLRDDLADAGRSASAPRPDAVAVFGLAGARARLEACVAGALGALDRGRVVSSELRRLAGILSLEPGA